MKRTISLLSVLAFVLAFSGSVFAQTDITASAQIVNSISVDGNTDNLQFGQLQGNFSQTPTIDPLSGNSNLGSGTTQAGRATITADPNVDFQVTVTAPDELENTADASATIPFTGHFYGDQDDDLSTGGDNTTLNTDGTANNVTTNGNSTGPHYYLHLGGELTPNGSGSYAGGTYEGTITISVNYL